MHTARRERHGPEETRLKGRTTIHTRVEIVNLVPRHQRCLRVDIESNERERALSSIALCPHEHALHEAYVRFPQKAAAGPIPSRCLTNVGAADESSEVADRRDLVAGAREEESKRGRRER